MRSAVLLSMRESSEPLGSREHLSDSAAPKGHECTIYVSRRCRHPRFRGRGDEDELDEFEDDYD
jgi:hypothetical protein